jgi:hypothetical protein
MRTRYFVLLLFAFFLAAAANPATAAPAGNTAIEAAPRERGWLKTHEAFVARAKKGDVDVLFMGDSITNGWRRHKIWKEKYVPLKAVDFGIGGDRTQHVLWRIEHGECDGITPKVVVLMIGTNNLGRNSAAEIVDGITAIVNEFRTRLPQSKILLLGIFPRGAKHDDPAREKIQSINRTIAKLDDGKQIKYLDIGTKFLDAKGDLPKEVMPDALHPNAKGYQIWADAMDPTLKALLK